MEHDSRRNFLLQAGAGAAALLVSGGRVLAGDDPAKPSDPHITCFYQFGAQALKSLSGPEGLPDGPRYLHIFSHSHPGMNPHPDTAKAVHACGRSFRYAPAFDVHKYPGWTTAPEDQLRTWAMAFREQTLNADGPADYFAFNEMPTTGAATPHLRDQTAKLLRLLYSAGGGPKLRGIFYFTERNLNPQNWQGEADGFWTALDETCLLIVGEHYHNAGFTLSKTEAQLADHLFALPKWLQASGKPAEKVIAGYKYAVLHSSYYGQKVTGWAGLQTDKQTPEDLEKYVQFVVAATRSSEFGKKRIAFGPLATTGLDPAIYPALARVLHKDLTAEAGKGT
jgi:hypothetical protein